MEANIFPKKEVEAELSKFVLARLFTDDGSDINNKQQEFEQNTFGTVALPFYAIMNGDGKTVATFPGLTRNVQEFVDFLKKSEEN
jgi:thiol:disulfide interchange protein DsbD